MTQSEQTPQWRIFLHALSEEIDGLGGSGARDELLRGVGRRVARYQPILPSSSPELLEFEMNSALTTLGWGHVTLEPDNDGASLTIIHTDMPRIGGTGDPPGTWLAAMLEGLYAGWLSQIPGADPESRVSREVTESHRVVFVYGQ